MPAVSSDKLVISPPASRPLGRNGGAASSPIGASGMTFEHAATVVLGGLQHALLDMFAAAPSEIRKAADVERVFGVNHLLGWQTYKIAHAPNPLAAGTHVPAKVSMKKLLSAAARRKVPSEVINQVSEAFDAFEQLVESDAGDRDEFESLLNAFLPEERAKQELASKQASFKAMSQLRGIASETDVGAMIFYPSDEEGMIDRATLSCDFGLRRSRPETPIVFGSGDSRSRSDHLTSAMVAIDGSPCDGPMGILLPQFCTTPLPEFRIHEVGDTMYWCMGGNDVGLRAAADLVLAERRRAVLPKYRPANGPLYGGASFSTTAPVKRMTLDAFFHRDVYPGVSPQLWIYDTAGRKPVRPIGDPNREFERLYMQETVRSLPAGLAGTRLPHVPRYIEMLEFVFNAVGLNPDEFRCYRLDVQYPLHAAEYILGFRLPERPDGEAH